MLLVDRRRIILSAAAAAGIAAIAGCARSTKRGGGRDVLTPFLLLLFPQPGVDSSVYRDIARRTRETIERLADWAILQA